VSLKTNTFWYAHRTSQCGIYNFVVIVHLFEGCTNRELTAEAVYANITRQEDWNKLTELLSLCTMDEIIKRLQCYITLTSLEEKMLEVSIAGIEGDGHDP
jgi:hypothetical protein